MTGHVLNYFLVLLGCALTGLVCVRFKVFTRERIPAPLRGLSGRQVKLVLFALWMAPWLLVTLCAFLGGSSEAPIALLICIVWASIGAGILGVYTMLRRLPRAGEKYAEESSLSVLLRTCGFFAGTMFLRLPMILDATIDDAIRSSPHASEIRWSVLAWAIPAVVANIYALAWGARLLRRGLIIQSLLLYLPMVADYFVLRPR
jgi:hypothetical protein